MSFPSFPPLVLTDALITRSQIHNADDLSELSPEGLKNGKIERELLHARTLGVTPGEYTTSKIYARF